MAELVAVFMAGIDVPLTGAGTLPTIRIRRLDTGALVVTDAAMVEVGAPGDGAYSFTFAPVATLEYSWRANGDPLAAGQTIAGGRFTFGILSGIDATSSVIVPYLGSIWIDTANGSAGTVVGVNGLPSNPSDNLADALTLAASTGLRSFVVITGNLTLTGALTEWFVVLRGGSQLDFGGFSVNESEFYGGTLTGVGSGTITVRDAILEDVSGVVFGVAQRCGLGGTTAPGVGESTFDRCRSQEPGLGIPILDFGVGGPARTINVRAFSGGIQIENMDVAGDVCTIEYVAGRTIVDASCTAGTLVLRGITGPITDGSAGTTVNIDGEVSKLSVAQFLETLGPNPHGTGVWTGTTPAAVATAVWSEPLPGAFAGGTAGFHLDAPVSLVPAATDIVLSAAHGAGSWEGSSDDRVNVGWARLDAANVEVTISGRRNGADSPLLTAAITFFNSNGTVRFTTAGPGAPDAQGVIRFNFANALVVQASYWRATVTDATGAITTTGHVPFTF